MSDDLQNPWENMQDEFRMMTPRHPPPPPPPPTRSGYADRTMLLVPSWQSAHDPGHAGQQHRTGGAVNKIHNAVIQPKGHGKVDQPQGKGYANEPKGKGKDKPKGKGNLEGRGTNNNDPHDNIVSQDAQYLQDARAAIQRLQYQNNMLLRIVDNLQGELMELRQTVG